MFRQDGAARQVLRHRNFRLLWIGNTSNQFGDFIQQVAQSWLVWEITGSVTALGLAAFVGMVPRIFFGVFGGPVVDRYNRRRLLTGAQAVAFAAALAFAAMVFAGRITFMAALGYILVLEITAAVAQTARQALLHEIIPRSDIAGAIALNSMGNNVSRTLGPALGGLMIPLTGVGGLILVNAATYLIIISAVLMINIPIVDSSHNQAAPAKFLDSLLEGYRYIWRYKRLRILIYLFMISALLINPYNSLLPAYVEKVLLGGPRLYGLMTAAYGLGAVAGAVNSVGFQARAGGTVTLAAAIAQGLVMVYFGLSALPVLAPVLLFLLGAVSMIYSNRVMTAVQLAASPQYLGRVIGFFLIHRAVTGGGSILLAFAADQLGVGLAFAVSGALYLFLGPGVQYINHELRAEVLNAAVKSESPEE